MTQLNKILVRSIAVAAILATSAAAQALVFSTTTDQPGNPVPIYDEELHVLDAAGRWPAMTREMLGILAGDADGDGLFDDQPIDVDAAHASGLPYPGEFYLSSTADFQLADGTLIEDGDVFHFTDAGAVVDVPEAFFEGVTGTSGVDVDAFAIAANGDLYFSFAEDEPTTDAGLVAQNGGIATLDEQCVFRFVPGAQAATVFLSPAAVVAAFNHAFGATATTVVDTCDVEIDPASPADLLLTSLSTATAFRGKVITTAGGGAPFLVGGLQAGPSAMGLSSTAQLDALAITSLPRLPILRAIPEIVSAAAPTVARVESSGWAPGSPVQFVTTDAVLPRPTYLPYPLHTGYATSPLDPANPLFIQSFSIAAWLVVADASGTAAYAFATAGLPAGINAIVQSVNLATGQVSTPVSVAFTP